MVLVQKWPFFRLSFFGNIGQENVCYDILERKSAFLGYKNKNSKSRKIDVFPKGLSHGFGPKMARGSDIYFHSLESLDELLI